MENDYSRISAQLAVLKELQTKYGGRTLDNVIQELVSIKKWHEEQELKNI